MQRIIRPAAILLAFFGVTFLLPYLNGLTSAYADTYSVPYPLCNVSAVQITTAPGETAGGMVSITLGGGNAYSTACAGFTGYVGLAVLGGSASGQLVAIALDGESATGTNAGLAVAPFGYASNGAVNIGCTAGTGINAQWCPFFQTEVSPTLQGTADTTFAVAGFPSCSAANPNAMYTDSLGIEWYCDSISITPDTQSVYLWTPTLSTSVVLEENGPPPVGGRSCRINNMIGVTGIGFRTIDFNSNLTCTEPVLMEITTELRFATTNSLEATGTPFEGSSASGDSGGSFNFAVVGTQHKFTSFTRATTLDGALWVGTDSRCVGWGTISIYCVVSTTFTV